MSAHDEQALAAERVRATMPATVQAPAGAVGVLLPGSFFVTLDVDGAPTGHAVCDSGHVHEVPDVDLDEHQLLALNRISRLAADRRAAGLDPVTGGAR